MLARDAYGANGLLDEALEGAMFRRLHVLQRRASGGEDGEMEKKTTYITHRAETPGKARTLTTTSTSRR